MAPGLLLCTLYIFNVLTKKGYEALVNKACYNDCNNSNCAAAMTGSFIAVINTCFFIKQSSQHDSVMSFNDRSTTAKS